MSAIVTLTPLPGHTTPETAYVVDNYPYGYRLRCKIRYWLEHRSRLGFRLVSQTTNPKVPHEHWNKPKPSTYSMLAVMGLDAEGHVTWTGCSIYEFDKLKDFEATYGYSFDDNQRKTYNAALAAYERYEARKGVRP